MSKHHHDDCCYPVMAGYGGYGMGGYYGAGYGVGAYGASWGIRWIYALLILIVIVLQFGRRNECVSKLKTGDGCCDDGAVIDGSSGFLGFGREGLIDNSVLFIIVVFLLILCAGCWWGYGGGYGGGCGSF